MTFQEHVKIGPRGAGGLVNTFTIPSAGQPGGTPPGGCSTTINNLTQDSISGTGAGAAFDVTCSAGVYSAVVHNTNPVSGTRGYGYKLNGSISTLTINGTHFPGGTSPANDVMITISTCLFNVVGAPPLDEFVNSYFELWIGRDGQHSEPVISWGPWGLSAGTVIDDEKFGKLWLLAYDTGRSATGFPVANTNYAHVVISTNKIADPVASGFIPPPPVDTGGSRKHLRP